MTLALPKPAHFNPDNLAAELLEAGRSDIMFSTDDHNIIFTEGELMRDWLIDLLARHISIPRPLTPTEVQRLGSLEAWSVDVNATVDQLIMDSLFTDLTDDDILADLGGF